MLEVGGIGRLMSGETRRLLDIMDAINDAPNADERTRLVDAFRDARLKRVFKVQRERPEILTLEVTTGGAISIVPTTISTDERLERAVDLFAAGVIQATNTGLVALNFHIDLRHSRGGGKSFFSLAEGPIVRGKLFDLMDSSTSVYSPPRELAAPVTLRPGEYLTLDLYHDIETDAPVRTQIIFIGRSRFSADDDAGKISARSLERVTEIIASRDMPTVQEVVATFTWDSTGAPGGTAKFRSPSLNEPVIVRALYAPNSTLKTINRLRVGANGLPFMTEPIPLRLLSQAGTGVKTTALVHAMELPVPIFLPEGERLYADLTNSIEGAGGGGYDGEGIELDLIKMIVETV